MPFFIFQRNNPRAFTDIAHLLITRISVTHNKNRNPSLNSLINCIQARSTPQILSLKDEYTFHFLNFLVIGLCNSSEMH